MTARDRVTILALERDPSPFLEFYDAASLRGEVHFYPTLEGLLADEPKFEDAIFLLDVEALQASPSAQVAQLVELRSQHPMGLVTTMEIEEYLLDIRRWGILQSAIKVAPIIAEEVTHFIECVKNPANAIGLYRYLNQTVQMYNVAIETIEEKNLSVERVINHFATAGFEIHELYDVRLILEETLNNAIFHAFQLPNGDEKYGIGSFKKLDEGEKVRIEYGSSTRMAGFTVTDNSGSLKLRTIINKLERQFNRDGLFDESGRGLYLSRMMSTAFIINLEPQKRTQVIALFDERRRTDRPKPLMINNIGEDSFEEWRLDPDMD